jgi:cell division protein FtsQ
VRQVRPKRSPRTAAVRSGGRLRAVRGRTTSARSQKRGKSGNSLLASVSRYVGSSFFVRHPLTSMTLLLVVLASGVGLLAGGHISNTVSAAEASMDRAFAAIGFGVNRITLEGQSRTSPNDVYTAIGLDQGQSIFALDPRLARARLMNLPWVADAGVKRLFPDTVQVTLIEKLPFALWKHGSNVDIVERSGAVITHNEAGDFSHLPLLIGEGAPQAAAALIDAISASRGVSARLRVAERVGGRRWNLVLDGPVAVKLPEVGWEREIGTLERMIVEDGVLERDIEVIDLRFADRYIFRLRNGDSQTASRERPT